MLALSGARTGARSYIAFAGGIDTPPVLGSRSTFHMAGVGGVNGYALKAGQQIPVAEAQTVSPILEVATDRRPPIGPTREWQIEVVAGPNDSWLDAAGIERFLSSPWTVQAKSSRTGMRLTGPAFTFSERANNKRPEHGQDPSNILDHGYPLGAINLAGQTPTILINDGPSTGGFINPFTVPSAAFWKLGQARPGNIFRFHAVTVAEAQDRRRALDHSAPPKACSPPERSKHGDPPRRRLSLLRNEFFVLISAPSKVKRSQPSTATFPPCRSVPRKRHSETPRSPEMKCRPFVQAASGNASKTAA